MVAHLLTKNENKTFKQPFIHLFLFVVFFNKSQWTFVCGEAAPVLVNAVSSLVQRQRFDLVLANLARLGLQSGCDVSLQGAILTFDGPHLEQDAMWMNGTSLFYYLQRMMKRQHLGYSAWKIHTDGPSQSSNAGVTLSSSLVVLVWHLYVARRKFPLGCWEETHESRISADGSKCCCCCCWQGSSLTSASHSLKLTTAEFLSTSSRSIGTSLCVRHCAPRSLF